MIWSIFRPDVAARGEVIIAVLQTVYAGNSKMGRNIFPMRVSIGYETHTGYEYWQAAANANMVGCSPDYFLPISVASVSMGLIL